MFDDLVVSDEGENSSDVDFDNGFYEDSMIAYSQITREQADKFEKFIKGVSRRQAPIDHEVINIIIEESAAYFANKKSLDETVRIIESRAFIYVSENM